MTQDQLSKGAQKTVSRFLKGGIANSRKMEYKNVLPNVGTEYWQEMNIVMMDRLSY